MSHTHAVEHVVHLPTDLIQHAAASASQNEPISPVQSQGTMTQDASPPSTVRLLTCWAVQQAVQGKPTATIAALRQCWSTAAMRADDLSMVPRFEDDEKLRWINAVRDTRVLGGVYTLGLKLKEVHKKSKPAVKQEREAQLKAELFPFDFATLRLRIDGDGSGKGAAAVESAQIESAQIQMGSAHSQMQSITSSIATSNTEVVCVQQRREMIHELPSVSVRLTCVLGGVQLHVRVAGREQLDFSTASESEAKRLPRQSVAAGRGLLQANQRASDEAMRLGYAGERKRWKDWDDVEALREQRAALEWGMRKAEAKQGRTDAELEAARARWVGVEKEMAEQAAMREAERKQERELRKKATKKAADAVAMEREKRKDAEEQVVCLQEEMGKEELVRRRVAEENARSKKRSSAFEAASEKACLFTLF